MASLINELRREATTVKWTVATFLGGAINSVLWSQYLFFSQHIFSSVETLTIFSLFFAIIIVIYSIASSLLLPMKRVVALRHSISFVCANIGYWNHRTS